MHVYIMICDWSDLIWSGIYQLGVDAKGSIQNFNLETYSERGIARNDPFMGFLIMNHVQNLYDAETWTIVHYDVKTELTPHTFARAPGK